MLKYAGYDAVVVEGESAQPVYLWIDDDRAELRDAEQLWGKGTFDTQDHLMSDHGPDVRALTIGQAGENRSRIAIVATGTGSAAGQGGFGAVMGAKRLKAIAVRGTQGVPLAMPEAFSDCTLSIAKELHAACGIPRHVSIDPDLKRDFGQRFAACTQQCASSDCVASRFCSSVPGVVHPEKDYSGLVVCESGIFAGLGEASLYDWEVGFQGGFELTQISQDLGLNHWELGIGMVPWLRKCQEEGLITDLDGEPLDFDSPRCWDILFRKIAYREGIGDALAEGGVRAAKILGLGEELIPESYAAWGFAGHWDGRVANKIVFPYWLVSALQWAVSTRDPMGNGHGYAQNVTGWSPISSPEAGLDWGTLAEVGARVYGTRQAVHPESGYEAKAYPAVWHGHRSIIKDSVTVDDQMFPRIYSNKTPDHFARAQNGMEGPSFEYHMFRLATGMDVDEAEFERMAERAFNVERALQVRNWNRSRSVDEQVIPYFEQIETWVNPFIGHGLGLDREKFDELLDEYYALRGWDVDTGRPTRAKLEQLDLPGIADDLAQRGLV
jgi:aldehyde:ferredoxin oxidoreductase